MERFVASFVRKDRSHEFFRANVFSCQTLALTLLNTKLASPRSTTLRDFANSIGTLTKKLDVDMLYIIGIPSMHRLVLCVRRAPPPTCPLLLSGDLAFLLRGTRGGAAKVKVEGPRRRPRLLWPPRAQIAAAAPSARPVRTPRRLPGRQTGSTATSAGRAPARCPVQARPSQPRPTRRR